MALSIWVWMLPPGGVPCQCQIRSAAWLVATAPSVSVRRISLFMLCFVVGGKVFGLMIDGTPFPFFPWFMRQHQHVQQAPVPGSLVPYWCRGESYKQESKSRMVRIHHFMGAIHRLQQVPLPPIHSCVQSDNG